MPPRRLFSDGAHYGAMLNFLDGVDRLREAILAADGDNQGWYAAWAVRSFDKAHESLAASDAGRVRGREIRPEFRPETIARSTSALRQQALALITQEYAAPIVFRPVPMFAILVM